MDSIMAARATLERSGLPPPEIIDWLSAEPKISGDYADDALAHMRFWRVGEELLAGLPHKAERSEPARQGAEALHHILRASRDRFLAAHVETLYRAITQEMRTFVRAERLVYTAAELLPGLVPSIEQIVVEGKLLQRDKQGFEVDQGILLSRVLAHPACGAHLCHAMLLPRAESVEHLAALQERGTLDLGAARVERRG